MTPVGARSEEIESGTHVQRLAAGVARIASQHGQVDGGAAAMAGNRRDVNAKQLRLVEVRIMRSLGALVGEVIRPAHEMRHRACRPVAVEHAQAQMAFAQRGVHPRQCLGGFALQPAARRLVAVDRRTDEVVAARIGDRLRDVGYQAADVDHAGLLHRGRRRHLRRSAGLRPCRYRNRP